MILFKSASKPFESDVVLEGSHTSTLVLSPPHVFESDVVLEGSHTNA